jgi:hypothetical protein
MSHRPCTVRQLTLTLTLILTTLAAPVLGDDGIVRVPIPADVQRADVLRADAALRTRLLALVEQPVAGARARAGGAPTGPVDRIVLFVDHDGQAILPDAEAAARRAADASTTNELQFTFDSPDQPWTDTEVLSLKRLLRRCYRVAKRIYGPPAFAITVNFRKGFTGGVGGYYDPTLNEATLPDTMNPDTTCHEMIHAFHDDYVIAYQGFEEGMTHAVEIEVFNRLSRRVGVTEHHSDPSDMFYEGANRPAIGAAGGNFFAGYWDPFLRYQLASYAWAKAMIENPAFFVDFNRMYYAAVATDPLAASEASLVAFAAAAQPTVEGLPFEEWYARQYVLSTNPPIGTFLYQRSLGYIDVLRRVASGAEMSLPGIPVDWAARDFAGTVLQAGSSTTYDFGVGFFDPTAVRGYAGRVTFTLDTTLPEGPLTDTLLLGGSADLLLEEDDLNASGVFGAVPDRDTGSVTITRLPDGMSRTAPLVQGGFSVPGLARARGPFLATFTSATGETVTHRFTKDAAAYFVQMPSVDPTTTTSSTSTTSTSSTSTSEAPATTSSSTSTTTSTVTTTTALPTMIRVRAFSLKDDAISPARRKIIFKAKSGSGVVAPAPGGDGDPSLGGAVLTVYNAACQPIRVRVDLPASNWRVAAGSSYDYADDRQSLGPIKKVLVKPSGVVTIVGGGATWGYALDTFPQGLVAVRLALGTGVEWCAVLPPKTRGEPPSSEHFDREDLFRAAADASPPPDCPPVP